MEKFKLADWTFMSWCKQTFRNMLAPGVRVWVDPVIVFDWKCCIFADRTVKKVSMSFSFRERKKNCLPVSAKSSIFLDLNNSIWDLMSIYWIRIVQVILQVLDIRPPTLSCLFVLWNDQVQEEEFFHSQQVCQDSKSNFIIISQKDFITNFSAQKSKYSRTKPINQKTSEV